MWPPAVQGSSQPYNPGCKEMKSCKRVIEGRFTLKLLCSHLTHAFAHARWRTTPRHNAIATGSVSEDTLYIITLYHMHAFP